MKTMSEKTGGYIVVNEEFTHIYLKKVLRNYLKLIKMVIWDKVMQVK